MSKVSCICFFFRSFQPLFCVVVVHASNYFVFSVDLLCSVKLHLIFSVVVFVVVVFPSYIKFSGLILFVLSTVLLL